MSKEEACFLQIRVTIQQNHYLNITFRMLPLEIVVLETKSHRGPESRRL